MKKILALLLLAPILTMAQGKPKPFSIDGKIDGYDDGVTVTLYKNGDNTELGKTTVQKGKFLLKGNIEEPVLGFLVLGTDKPIEIYLESKPMQVKGTKADPDHAAITGSSSHKDFADFTKTFLPIAQSISTLAASINNTMPGAQRDTLLKTYHQMQDNFQEELDKFVKQHTRSYVTPFLLNITYQFKEDILLLEKRFNLLDAAVKNSQVGQQLKNYIAENKVGAVGTEALDFTQSDTTGHPVSLSSFRGKYVLLDFWASWCGPCRQENPNVVANYKKFSQKNFTVLSVSLDRPGQKDKWIEAINADNLTWTHVSDLQFWNNSAAQLYHVQAIPLNFLIDPNGKIIGKNLRGPELEAKLCEVLGCN